MCSTCLCLYPSVSNTAKRALLIWISVLIFGNPVTLLSAVGTMVVIVGVFCYQQALLVESKRTVLSPSHSPRHNIYVKPP